MHPTRRVWTQRECHTGDWVELWHEDTQSVSYLHLKTGVKRKKPPKERSTTPRSHVRARSASALVRPGSPLIAGSLASSPRSVGSRSLGGSSRSRTPRTPRRNPLDAMRSQSARARTLSPLRLRTISHIRRPGSFTGSVGSVFSDESKGAPASPDTPQSVFRKKRYRFLCGLRRRQTRQRPGTPTTMGSGVLFLPLDRDNIFIQSYEKVCVCGGYDCSDNCSHNSGAVVGWVLGSCATCQAAT